MRIFWTVFWAFLLSLMMAYVVSNMTGNEFSFLQAIIMTVIFSGTVIALGEGLIKEES
ncbi:YjzD family protein [Halobacillus salinarum]|uniref:YjzD family protein n=1 Tax=Halobacillus salinarum TaxID=2932257 RepID=A0ABY4EG68_9BACI|nr:YjzD family protein [Halobacillus salinarum]UOQ43447.1 YjzD family protein [Halobacillus salinarum]